MFNYAYEKTETQSPGVAFILFYCICIFVLLHTPVVLTVHSLLAVLSVGSSYIALQCPQVQVHHYHVGLWTGHHLCPQLPAPAFGAQVSH